MLQNNKSLFELTIQFSTIYLSPDIAKNKDTIRISITTLPEKQKAHFHFKVKELKGLNRSLSVNITKNTTKLIIVFRKRGVFGSEPIIASTVIGSKHFPELPADSSLIKMPLTCPSQELKIYIPILPKSGKSCKVNGLYESINDKIDLNRKSVGQAQIELSVWKPSNELFFGTGIGETNDKNLYTIE